jgi:hypothetical protein
LQKLLRFPFQYDGVDLIRNVTRKSQKLVIPFTFLAKGRLKTDLLETFFVVFSSDAPRHLRTPSEKIATLSDRLAHLTDAIWTSAHLCTSSKISHRASSVFGDRPGVRSRLLQLLSSPPSRSPYFSYGLMRNPSFGRA